MKHWILQTFFKKELEETFKNAAIDAFRKADKEFTETREDDVEERAEELAKEKLSNLLSTVDYRKVVTIDKAKGLLFVGGERVDDARIANLHSEALFIMESDMWKLLVETPKELAQKAMFVQGESMADLQKGKSILYTLSAQQNILDIFHNYKK